MGAIGVPGGVFPNAWNKFVPKPIHTPPHPPQWNELTWPQEYPLAMNEMSFLLPHFLKDGRGKLDVYFTRVYNPVWTNPDGLSWIEAITDESEDRPARGAHARPGASRPTSPTTCCPWASAPSATTCTRTRRTTRSGSASASRC